MNKTTEPAAPEPVATVDCGILNWLDGMQIDSGDPYSAATVKQLVQERDANTAYFEAYHQLRVAVNAAYPQDPYQLAEDVPALMQQQLAAMTQERDIAKHNEQCTHDANKRMSSQLFASQAREQQLRRLLDKCYPHPLVSIEYNEILALPQDDTALRQWGAKLLREIADGCRDGIDRAWITSKADELMEEKGNG